MGCARISLLLLIMLLSGCGAEAPPVGCPDGSEPLETAFDLGEDPVVSASPEEALERFLRQSNSTLQAQSFERSRGGGAPTFDLEAEGVGPVRIDVTRLENGWIVVAYEACRGTF